jgi:hypothetical protein
MAALHCDVDIIVSRNQVCRSSQYGVIERKTAGTRGSRGAYMTQGVGTLLMDTNRVFALRIGGRQSCDLDRPWTEPTQPILAGKHSYLPAEKVEEIEDWLAKVDPEGDEGSLEAY